MSLDDQTDQGAREAAARAVRESHNGHSRVLADTAIDAYLAALSPVEAREALEEALDVIEEYRKAHYHGYGMATAERMARPLLIRAGRLTGRLTDG